MADMNAAVVVSLIDQFSANGAKFKSTLKSMKGQVRDFAGGLKSGIKAELAPRFDAANFDKQMGVLDARVSKARSRLMGAVGMAIALAMPLKLAAQFDQSFKGLEKVVDAPISKLKQLRKFALETSTLVPIAARDVLELMSEAAQGGVPQDELEVFALFAANAAVAFDMAGAKIGERFAKLRNVYKLNQKGIEKLGDATNHLSNKFAAKASEITNFTNRAAGASKILHMNAIEMSAIGAALIASGIVPETAARGVNAFAARIEKGGKKVKAAFKMIGTSREEFLKAVKQDGAKAFTELFKSLSKSEEGMRALIDLVGTDFADDFAKLLGNPELLEAALKRVEDQAQYTGSVINEAAKQASGAERQWDLLINKIAATGIKMGDTLLPKFLAIADGVGGMVTSFSQFADANPNLSSAIMTTVGAILALSIASRVLGLVWAVTGKELFKGMSLFVMMKDGKNVAKLAPVMNALKATLLALPGPLKLVGLAALAAGAAFAYFGDDFASVRDHMAEDSDGFARLEKDLFGVEKSADGAADALGRFNKAQLAAKVVDNEGKLKDRKAAATEALNDAVDTTVFDAGGDDLSAGGKKEFEAAFKDASNKINSGTFAAEDGKALQGQIDKYITGKGEKIGAIREALDQEISKNEKKTFNFGSGRQRSLKSQLQKQLEDFNRDNELIEKLRNTIKSVVLTQQDIAQAKAQLAEANRPKDAHDPSQPIKPQSSAKKAPAPTPKTAPRDQAGRDALALDLQGLDKAAKTLETAGDAAGKKLGNQANSALEGNAAAIGAQIGRAASDVIRKTVLSVKVAGPAKPAKGKVSGSGALHDGVD